jgi:hypothetical protein
MIASIPPPTFALSMAAPVLDAAADATDALAPDLEADAPDEAGPEEEPDRAAEEADEEPETGTRDIEVEPAEPVTIAEPETRTGAAVTAKSAVLTPSRSLACALS